MFSVVIPTRNRPALLQRAVESVLAQTLAAQDVIVVVDGAVAADLDAYHKLQLTWATRPIRWLHLPHRAQGHGPSFTRNHGAASATGDYLAFLDDDDLWALPDHLHRAQLTLQAHGLVDLYMTAQVAVKASGDLHPGPLWLDGLEADCPGPPDDLGNVRVPIAAVASRVGFSHLNCSIYRREFFQSLGGLDEQMRYEEDRDLYLRAIDAAATLLYNPMITARHFVPDRSAQDNASTTWTRAAQLLQQMRMLDKCIVGARHAKLRQQARTLKSYALHDLADLMERDDRLAEAAAYRREALGQRLSPRGLRFAFTTSLRALLQARRT